MKWLPLHKSSAAQWRNPIQHSPVLLYHTKKHGRWLPVERNVFWVAELHVQTQWLVSDCSHKFPPQTPSAAENSYLLLRDKGAHPLSHSHQHAQKNIILTVPLPCKKESWDCLPFCITHQLAYWQIHPLQSVFLLCNNLNSSWSLLLFFSSKQTIALVDMRK